MKYGDQIGVIVYGSINARHYADLEIKRGNVIVWCDGYARIHKSK